MGIVIVLCQQNKKHALLDLLCSIALFCARILFESIHKVNTSKLTQDIIIADFDLAITR
jgi:hypothetical protein